MRARALSQLGEHPVDVMLTDVTLPDMPGPQLCLRAWQRQPRLPVVFASGHGPSSIDALARKAGFLRKPYTPDDLEHALRAAMRDASAHD